MPWPAVRVVVMADRQVEMDVRMAIVTWPVGAPRGAVSRFCREHGVSRSRFYEIRARSVAQGPVAALTRAPRTPWPPSPGVVAVEEVAVRVRKELAEDGWDCGPISVRAKMVTLGIVGVPSRASLARLFARRGLSAVQPQKRPRVATRRFCYPRVHECWQLDATEWRLRDGTVVAIFQLLDDHSRYLVGSLAASGETTAAALAVWTTAIARFGVPQLLLSDNGAALNPSRRGQVGALVTAATSAGCRPITGRPGHPQTQGKNERVHATLHKWLRARPAAPDLDSLNTLLTQFDQHYNQHRPHQSLQMRTPAQALTDGITATAPSPPAPTTPTTAAPPPLRTYSIKVSSNGKARIRRTQIHIGAQHAGTHVIGIQNGTTITITDHHGTILRTITTQPGRTYYGSTQPSGLT